MKRILVAIAVLVGLCGGAQAQGMMGTVGGPFAVAATYTGLGDLQVFTMWWGLRAYSAATRGANAIQICNVSDVTCENEKTNATTGVLVLGTVGSTCNNSTVICTVKTWYDQTVGGNCTGSCDAVQATIANRCTLVITPFGSSPATAACSGSSTFYQTAGAWSQPAQFTAYWYGERTASFTSQGNVIVVNTVGSQQGYAPSTNTLIFYDGSVGNATASDSAWHAIVGVINSPAGATTSFAEVDATNTGTLNLGSGSGSGAIDLFGDNFNGRYPAASFTEAGVIGSVISAGIAASLNANANAFY